MSAERQSVLWTREMYDDLIEKLAPVQALVEAYGALLRDCERVDPVPATPGSTAPHPLETACREVDSSFDALVYPMADLAACTQWAIGHVYHEPFSPVTPAVRPLRAALMKSFLVVLGALRAVEADLIRMEVAAESVERGEAVINGEDHVVMLLPA